MHLIPTCDRSTHPHRSLLPDPMSMEDRPFRGFPLTSLLRGRPARVVGFVSGDAIATDLESRLREIGFHEDAEVELLHRGPLGGDPLAIRIDRTTIAIRRSEARAILVDREK